MGVKVRKRDKTTRKGNIKGREEGGAKDKGKREEKQKRKNNMEKGSKEKGEETKIEGERGACRPSFVCLQLCL